MYHILFQRFLNDFKTISDSIPYLQQLVGASLHAGRDIYPFSSSEQHMLKTMVLSKYNLRERRCMPEVMGMHEIAFDYLTKLSERTDWLLDSRNNALQSGRSTSSNLIENLLDVSNCDDRRLLTFAFTTLNRIFSRTESLLSYAESSLVLTVPESNAFAQRVLGVMPEIRNTVVGAVEQSEVPFVFIDLNFVFI